MVLAVLIYIIGIMFVVGMFILFEMDVSNLEQLSTDDYLEASKFKKELWNNIKNNLPEMILSGCLWPYFLITIIIDFIRLQFKRK